MFDAHMSNNAIHFEGNTEYVVLIRAVTDDERATRFRLQQFLRHLTANRAPVPAILQIKMIQLFVLTKPKKNLHFSPFLCWLHSRGTFSFLRESSWAAAGVE